MSELSAEERAVLLDPCACGCTINDHGSLVACWRCEDEGRECAVTFEALLVERTDRILADRTATLARELAEARESVEGWRRTARLNAEDAIGLQQSLTQARERLARVAKIRDTLSHCYEAGDSNAGCPAGAGYFDLIADELSAALHAPADAPHGGSEDASTGTPTDAGHAGGSDE